MAESNEPLLSFEGSVLDINENMPNSENCSFPNAESLVDSASHNTSSENDSVFIKTFNSPEPTVDALEACCEMPSNNLDVSHPNRDEHANNQKVDSGIHDSENNIIENIQLIEFDGNDEQNFSENGQVMISDFAHEENDTEFKDEDFHDAVQFFKDPSSLVFLENAGSSNVPTESLMARSSLYQKFDPLHAKFFSQSNASSNELKDIAEDEIEPELNLENALAPDNLKSELGTDEPQSHTNATPDELQGNISCEKESVPEILNKHLSNVSPRESLGNILISFDSPVINKDTTSHLENEKICDPQKMYTEDELQQAIKIQELTIQEIFLKKQQELEAKVESQKCLSNSLYAVLKEAVDLVYVLSDKEKLLNENLEMAENEKNKLKEDLKTSMEDIQSVETTFADFHKRYEQCKNMLKVYTENEKSLKQQLENMSLQLHEKEEMYKALQSRTQEMLDKANNEVANAKKAGDAQIAVLKAQLKKSELKISSLESDVKHVKIENGKLSSICDELMAKVSET